MVLGARPTVIRAFLCAETATDIAIQWMSKARIQNIFNKFLLQTKSVCPTKPRAISGVNNSRVVNLNKSIATLSNCISKE